LIAIQTLLLDSALIQDFLLRELKNWYGSGWSNIVWLVCV
jgi:hypothetical protein